MQSWRDLCTLPRPIWTLFFATLVNRTGSMALPFLSLYLISEAGFSAAAAGGVISIYGLVALLSGPVAGRLVDRVGSLRVMQGALLLTGLLQLCFPLAHSVAAVIGLAAAWSLVAEAYRPAALSATAALVPEGRRREAYALIRLAINLGMSIGPAVGGLLAGWDFRLIFLVDGCTSLLAAVVLILSGLPSGDGAALAVEARPPRSLLGPLRDPVMASFLLALICNALVGFQGESALPVYLVRDLGLSPRVYGLMFTLNTVMIVTMEIPLTGRLSRFQPRHVLAVGALLTALGFGAIGLAEGVWGVLATVVIWTFGEMVFSPTATAVVSELAPEGERGAYMGLYSAAHAAAFMLTAPLGLWSLDLLGRGHWAAVLVLGLVGVLGLTRGTMLQR